VASSREIDRLRTAKNRLALNGVVTALHPATADENVSIALEILACLGPFAMRVAVCYNHANVIAAATGLR
jgi:hypothetical protein